MAKPTASVSRKKTTTTNPPSALPPYFKMITEAITTLKDRTGSSQPAIAKFAEEKYKKSLPSNFKKVLSVQLKKFVKSERLVKCKNSYKISSTEKLKLAIKETQKNKGTAKKISEKGVKTKRLSQVKTPEVFKKGKKEVTAAKMKKLSQVKTPDGFKQKNLTTMKMKSLKAQSSSSSRAHKKTRN